jgi:hypothetical protein
VVFAFNLHLTQDPCFPSYRVALGSGTGFPVGRGEGFELFSFELGSFAFFTRSFFLHIPTRSFLLRARDHERAKNAGAHSASG